MNCDKSEKYRTWSQIRNLFHSKLDESVNVEVYALGLISYADGMKVIHFKWSIRKHVIFKFSKFPNAIPSRHPWNYEANDLWIDEKLTISEFQFVVMHIRYSIIHSNIHVIPNHITLSFCCSLSRSTFIHIFISIPRYHYWIFRLSSWNLLYRSWLDFLSQDSMQVLKYKKKLQYVCRGTRIHFLTNNKNVRDDDDKCILCQVIAFISEKWRGRKLHL